MNMIILENSIGYKTMLQTSKNWTQLSLDAGNEKAAKIFTWQTMVRVAFLFTFVNQGYWLILFNITKFGGNVFTNGIMAGASECFSGIFAGMVMMFFSALTTYRVSAFVGILFCFIN